MISLNNKGKLKILPVKAKITSDVFSLMGIKLFCRAKLGKNSKDGHTDSSGGMNPTWPHAILTFYANNEEYVLIQVFQKGLLDNTLIGEAHIALASIYQNKIVKSPFNLLLQQKKVGEIHIEFYFEPEQTNQLINVNYGNLSNTIFYGNPFINQPNPNVISTTFYNPYQNNNFIQPYSQPIVQEQSTVVRQNNQQAFKDISQDEDPSIQDNELCVVCLTNKRAGAFYKCGHNCCCNTCGLTFIGKQCPVCREAVFDYIKIFTP